MFQLKIYNRQDHPISVQVDPFANTYRLAPGENITFVVAASGDDQTMDLEEFPDGFQILTLCSWLEYWVIRDGKKYHWRDYGGD